MKKLLFLILFIPLLAFTQVPQGVGYQGVATDAAGFELINQSISIRASVISGSATGTIEWQETHNTSTDTFGLFNLTIGQGTSTGNGAQTSFADITWGANTHFLKIEMDVNGGTNYSHMGTNQMMSVPYALYAENANINYDSIATILSNDSIFTNSFNLGGNISFGNYELLYRYGMGGTINPSDTILANSDGILFGTFRGASSSQNGGAYLHLTSNDSSQTFKNTINFGNASGYVQQQYCLPVKKDWFWNFQAFSGCIIMEIYWLPLESGGSSTSTVDSSYIDSLVQFYSSGSGGGCDFNYPDGLNGDPLTHDLLNSSYTVPPGKNLYITNFYSSQGFSFVYIDGIAISNGDHNSFTYRGHKAFIASSGQIISTNSIYPNTFNGFLVDANITPITHDLFNSSYIVPSGKNLYVTNLFSWQGSEIIYIDGSEISKGDINSMGSRGHEIFIASSGQVISSNVSTGNNTTFNGYLADENYFVDCRGGGSSSTSIDSSYIDSLVQFYSSGNGGGCNLRFPEGLNGTNIIEVLDNNTGNNPTYQVPMGKRLYILNAWGELEFDNILVFGAQGSYNSRPLYSPLIVDQGQIISNANAQYSFFNGFLVDYDSSVQAISVNGTNNIAYTVPNSKKLIITHVTLGTGSFQYGTISLEQNQNLTIPIIITEGTDIVTNNSSFNGYLVDENYFADCGAGGSSAGSSSSLDSLTIVSMINNITNNNQSIGVGDYYQGGVVGYIFQPGDSDYVFGETHGYIIRQGPGNDWGCIGVTTNVINNNIGQGPNNTRILDSLCTESNFAAKWCSDLVVGTYDDWFLPTYQEAILIDPSIYINHTTITNNNAWNMWLSEEFSPNPNPYNYNCPSCSSDNHAWALNYMGFYSVQAQQKYSSSTNKVIAFRKF